MNHFKSNKIEGAYKLKSGTIIVPDETEDLAPKEIAIYTRVSSSENKGNLVSQAERIRQWSVINGYTVIHEVSEIVCSSCGKQHKELKDLKIREWVCDCGAKRQRDYNASLNILKQGFKNISSELLDYRREEFLQEFCVAEGMKKFVETSTFL